MRGELQSLINPPQSIDRKLELSSEKATNHQTYNSSNKINFDEIIANSNYEIKKEKDTQKASGLFTGKENSKEFLNKLSNIKSSEIRTPRNTLDKNDFLRLFVTQLQNQDPLNPDDGTEMASKLAQFNSLEQMMNVNKTLEKLVEAQKINRTAELINYIGKEVFIDSGRFYFNGKDNAELKFELKEPSPNNILQIRNSNGTVILEKELGTMKEGENKILWNGKDNNEQLQPKGLYYFSLSARNIDNQPIEVNTKTKVKITGIDIQNKEESFYTNLGKIKLTDIKSLGVENFNNLDKLNTIEQPQTPHIHNQNLTNNIKEATTSNLKQYNNTNISPNNTSQSKTISDVKNIPTKQNNYNEPIGNNIDNTNHTNYTNNTNSTSKIAKVDTNTQNLIINAPASKVIP